MKGNNKQEKTVVGITKEDGPGREITVYYYAFISQEPGYVVLNVDESRPLSVDEVEKFFKNQDP